MVCFCVQGNSRRALQHQVLSDRRKSGLIDVRTSTSCRSAIDGLYFTIVPTVHDTSRRCGSRPMDVLRRHRNSEAIYLCPEPWRTLSNTYRSIGF
jgi:hypothetical protein